MCTRKHKDFPCSIVVWQKNWKPNVLKRMAIKCAIQHTSNKIGFNKKTSKRDKEKYFILTDQLSHTLEHYAAAKRNHP